MGTQPDEMTTGGELGSDVPDTTTNTDDDAQIEIVEAEIVETREDLADTVRQIGERLEPANLAREARESVTGAAMGKVEQMQMGAQETWRDVRSGNAGGILDMVKENPVPAGMVGLGLAMLLMNRGQKGGSQGQWQGGYQSRPDRYGSYDYGAYGTRYGEGDWGGSDGKGSPMSQVGDMASNARDAIGGAADTVGSRVSDMADSVGEMAGDLPEQAGQMWGQGLTTAQRFMEENPLGAGLIAVAAGAAIGMLIPTTSFERENVGPMRDQVVDKAASAAEDAIDSVSSSTGSGSGSSSSSSSKGSSQSSSSSQGQRSGM